MDSMEELAAFLEVENSISTRWLATNLGVHMQKARGLMAEYKEKNSGVSASYLVTGVASSVGRSYAVVAELDLEKYSSVSCEEIYSLHKLKSTANKIELQDLELNLGAEVFAMGHPHSQQFLSNSLGYLSCPSMDIKRTAHPLLLLGRHDGGCEE
ncbi:hypothetical protein B484DRAFT_447198 [Ochromonadaceae sp. CCMP2298]|nr:hypothetical protein B484DRAFT_447198 [Ochromonadaceae sp. CCMP2298]